MPKATKLGGPLNVLEQCYIEIPPASRVQLKILPDITDSKSAQYNDEPIIGRAFPMKTYSHSENRVIQMQLHFVITEPDDVELNLWYLRVLESAVYPRIDYHSLAPFIPPPVCQIVCGRLLGNKPLCVVMKQYSVKFPTDVAWVEHNDTYLPMKFDIDTSWDTVYSNPKLPGQEQIMLVGN